MLLLVCSADGMGLHVSILPPLQEKITAKFITVEVQCHKNSHGIINHINQYDDSLFSEVLHFLFQLQLKCLS